MKQTSRKLISGFSLIELAIVLVVIGILSAVGLETMTMVSENGKISDTKKKMDDIEVALASYLRLYGKLPCPSSRLLTDSDANFGKSEADCQIATAAPAGTTDIARTNTDENIRIGMIPIVDLGLPKAHAFDGWGNRFTYAVVKKLAIDSTTYDAYDDATGGAPASGTDGIIMMQDRSGNQLSFANLKTIIPYVLVSHGKDGKGGYNRGGNLKASCTGGSADTAFYNAITADAINDDIENCDNLDTVFIADNQFDLAGQADYYDDYVKYKTKNKLEADASKTTISSSAASAASPTNGIQYNGGSNAFDADDDLTFTEAAGLIGNDTSGTAVDFRWETDSLANALFVDASANKIYLGKGAASASGDYYWNNFETFKIEAEPMTIYGTNYASIIKDSELSIFRHSNYTKSTLTSDGLSFGVYDGYYGNPEPDLFPKANYTASGITLYSGIPEVLKTFITPSYINFSSTSGSGGYGLRDNAGAIEYKDSGGAWTAFNSISAGTTLPSCANGETIVKSGGVWTCTALSAVALLPSCSSGETLKYNGSAWVCDYRSGIIGSAVAYSTPGAQTLTDSYALLSGSTLSYTPKSATSNIYVTFSYSFAIASGTNPPIHHWEAFKNDGTTSTSIGKGSFQGPDYAEDRMVVSLATPSWGTTAGSVFINVRRYNSSYPTKVKQTRLMDGAASAVNTPIMTSIIEIE